MRSLGIKRTLTDTVFSFCRCASRPPAMVLTAVHLEPKTPSPIRWRCENSWSSSAGNDGYLTLTDKWFSDYVFQVVIHKDYLEPRHWELFQRGDRKDGKTVHLPAWDPFGSLA